MGKFILTIILFLITACCCFAQELILSDVIREAREAQLKQEAIEKAEEAMLKPVKNESKTVETEEEQTTKKEETLE